MTDPTEITRNRFADMPQIIFAAHGTPSWRRYGEGRKVFRAYGNPERHWVQLDLSETPKDGPSRTTMMAIDREAAVALHAFLGELLAGQPATPEAGQ